MRPEDDDWGLDPEQLQQMLRHQAEHRGYFEALERVKNLSPHDEEPTRQRVARAYFQAVDRYVDSLPDHAWQAQWAKVLAEQHRGRLDAASSTSPPSTGGPCRPLPPGTPVGRAGTKPGRPGDNPARRPR